jgi:hypothetical protein
MNQKTILENTRNYTLWAVLGSAGLLVILEILKAWDVVKTTSAGSLGGLEEAATKAMAGGGLGALSGLTFAAPSVNAWGRIEDTLGAILALGIVVLVALLVSSRTTIAEAKAPRATSSPANAPVATATASTAKATAAKASAEKPKK